MSTDSSCIPLTELEHFLLGRSEEERSRDIEDHLQFCLKCQHNMAALQSEDELVRALRKSPRGTSAAELGEVPHELVNLLVPQFKRISSAFEETVTFAGCQTAANGEGASRTSPPSINVPGQDGLEHPRQLGRYAIRGVLGRGGMGTVLHGFDPLLNRSVAIKVLQPEWLAEDGMSERLVREAQAAAAVEHDNIVSIFAVELLHGNPCIVMPLLKGETVQQRLERVDEPLTAGEFLQIARDASRGLAAAHAAGLIHCDIKPANLWLETPQGRVKILDFGLAIDHGDGHRDKGLISGTPGYLAPEQAKGLPLDQRTDIFSLGCVLYLMVTGRAPFVGERRLRALWTVLSGPPEAACQINCDLPAELSDLISRMMSREPADRPATMSEVVNVLDACERRTVELRNGLVRRRWLLAMFGTAVLTAASVGTWAMFAVPPAVKPVPVEIVGDEPALNVILQRDGRDWPLTLGPDTTTLSLPPGDYRVRPVSATDLRRLVPDQFVVVDQKSQLVRIALVGEIHRHTHHTQMVTGVVTVPNTQPPVIFSAGLDRALVRWEPTQAALPTFVNLDYSARCLAVSPNGDEVATAGGNKTLPQSTVIECRKPDQVDGPVRRLEGHTRIISALAYSPDGKWLAAADADGVRLWNRASGESQQLPVEPQNADHQAVLSLVFSAESRQLLAGGNQLTQWDLATLQPRSVRIPGTGSVRAMGLIKGGFATAGDDGIVRIWTDIDALPREFASISHPILALAASRDGTRLLTGDAESLVRIWSVATGEMQGIVRGHTRAVQGVAFVGQGRQAVSAGADGTVRLWQLPFP